MTEIKFYDRYEALGIPYPNEETVCLGECEGTGHIPIHEDDIAEEFKEDWDRLEKENPASDGWHFVECPDCNGTGKRK